MGNLIYRQLPNGENQYYQYDLENQLVRAEIKKSAGNTEIWTYAYDLFGRRFSKERQDKLAWTSTEPKRTHFVWDGTRLLQEYTYKGCYTYIYTDQDSYEPLAQVFDNAKDGKQYLSYFHNDQIGIPREMTDIHGNLLWYGEYTAWGRLKKDGRVYKDAHQPFRLQNQYFDEETGLHYNLMRYYEPDAGRFVNQDPIGLWGGENLYWFAPNSQIWIDPLGWVYVVYRTMSKRHFKKLRNTGRLKATGETFISTKHAYSSKYRGVLIRFEMQDDFIDKLSKIGVRDKSEVTKTKCPNMPVISDVPGDWTRSSAYFKGEKGVLNIGLGKGKGLDIFNQNIVSFKQVGKSVKR